jgi:hypothetical protein
MKQAEFARREAELQPALARELAGFRIVVSNDLPKRERCRLEGAIIRRLAADGAPLPDVGMLMHRTADPRARSGNGRSRGEGDIADRGGGCRKRHRSKDRPRKRKSIGSPQWRCKLFIEFAVPAWLHSDER